MYKFFSLVLLTIILTSCNLKSNTSEKVEQYDIKKGHSGVEDDTYKKFDNNDFIYFLGEAPIKLENADINSFKAYKKRKEINGKRYDAEDKNYYYNSGEIVLAK